MDLRMPTGLDRREATLLHRVWRRSGDFTKNTYSFVHRNGRKRLSAMPVIAKRRYTTSCVTVHCMKSRDSHWRLLLRASTTAKCLWTLFCQVPERRHCNRRRRKLC
uniref:Uncharacterized protein n=1 Tax=Rhipicephalus microplus TaxID=6941 RepID=A0A6G5AFY3_RHIMP